MLVAIGISAIFYLYLIKSLKFWEDTQNQHRNDINKLFNKYEQLTEKTICTIDKITDSFEKFVNLNTKDMNFLIEQNKNIINKIDSIDKKLSKNE